MDYIEVKVKDGLEKKFECAKCKKCLSTKFSMQRHTYNCGVIRSRLNCSNCNKSLKNADVLQKHRQICLGYSKKLGCGLCDELFCSTYSLKRHMWRFHEDEILKSTNYKIGPEGIIEIGKTEGYTQKNDIKRDNKHILNYQNLPSDSPKEEYIYRFYEVEADGGRCYSYQYLEKEECIL